MPLGPWESQTQLLDRQFQEKLLFEQAKISLKNFQLWLFRGNNQIFSQQTNFKDMVDV